MGLCCHISWWIRCLLLPLLLSGCRSERQRLLRGPALDWLTLSALCGAAEPEDRDCQGGVRRALRDNPPKSNLDRKDAESLARRFDVHL